MNKEQIQKELKKGNLKYVGSITESQIKSLKKGYVTLKTDSSDIMADVFGSTRRNIYVYKKLK